MGKPDKKAETLDVSKAPSAALEYQKLVTSEERAMTAILDRFGVNTGPNKVTEAHKKSLVRLLSTMDLTNPNEKPEENVRVLRIVEEELKRKGYTMTPIDYQSLQNETAAEEKAARVNSLARKENMPTKKYRSNVGIYGFSTVIAGSRMSYFKTAMDKIMDKISDLLTTAGDSGGNIFEALFKKPIRKKADEQALARNVRDFGLDKHFTVTPGGRVHEDIEDVKKGAFLDDVLRLRKRHPHLQKMDPDKALAIATKMVAEAHRKGNRGIGELLATDIVLQVDENGQVKGSRLALPDMVYSDDISVLEQKATDLSDFLYSVGSAGFQLGSARQAEKNIRTVIQNYPNDTVRKKVVALIDQGRPHPTMHNKIRLGFDRVRNKNAAFRQVGAIIKKVVKEEVK